MSTTTLSRKQARFVAEYMVDGCGAQAAIRSGVAPSGAHVWASRTLRIAKVSEVLKACQAADVDRLSVQREDVLNGLQEAINQAREQRNPAAMIAGWREIAKMLGFYSVQPVKVDIDVRGKVELGRYGALSDQQLLQIITAGQTAAH